MSLTYSGDTDACDGLVAAARDVDLFLCEAGFVEGRDTVRGIHLTGERAGEVATQARARHLVLTHIQPWTELEEVAQSASTRFATFLNFSRCSPESALSSHRARTRSSVRTGMNLPRSGVTAIATPPVLKSSTRPLRGRARPKNPSSETNRLHIVHSSGLFINSVKSLPNCAGCGRNGEKKGLTDEQPLSAHLRMSSL